MTGEKKQGQCWEGAQSRGWLLLCSGFVVRKSHPPRPTQQTLARSKESSGPRDKPVHGACCAFEVRETSMGCRGHGEGGE